MNRLNLLPPLSLSKRKGLLFKFPLLAFVLLVLALPAQGQSAWEQFWPGFYEISPKVEQLIPGPDNGVVEVFRADVVPTSDLLSTPRQTDQYGQNIPSLSFDTNDPHPWNIAATPISTAMYSGDSLYFAANRGIPIIWGSFQIGINVLYSLSIPLDKVLRMFKEPTQDFLLVGRLANDSTTTGTGYFWVEMAGINNNSQASLHYLPEFATHVGIVRLSDGSVVIGDNLPSAPTKLMRLDQQGNRAWSLQSQGFTVRMLAASQNGDFYIANENQVSRLDSNGQVLWSKQYAGSPFSFEAMTGTRDGGVLVGGRTTQFRPYGDPFVLKLDSSGVVEWSRAYVNTLLIYWINRSVSHVLEVEDGSIYTSLSNTYFDPQFQFQTPSLGLIRTDSMGFGCGDSSLTVTAMPDSLLLAPYLLDSQASTLLYSNGSFGPPVVASYYTDTATVACFTNCLAPPSATQLSPLIDTVFCPGDSLILDAGMGYTNYEWSTGDSGQVLSIGSSGWYTVSVTDSLGCIYFDSVLVDTAPVPTAFFGFSAIDTMVNFVYVGSGGSQYLWDFGDGDTSSLASPTHLYASGNYTACLTVTSPEGCESTYCQAILLVGTDNKEKDEILLYPNPARNKLKVHSSLSRIHRLQAFNALGELISNEDMEAHQAEIELAHLPSGMYWIKLKLEDKTLFRPFQVQR